MGKRKTRYQGLFKHQFLEQERPCITSRPSCMPVTSCSRIKTKEDSVKSSHVVNFDVLNGPIYANRPGKMLLFGVRRCSEISTGVQLQFNKKGRHYKTEEESRRYCLIRGQACKVLTPDPTNSIGAIILVLG